MYASFMIIPYVLLDSNVCLGSLRVLIKIMKRYFARVLSQIGEKTKLWFMTKTPTIVGGRQLVVRSTWHLFELEISRALGPCGTRLRGNNKCRDTEIM